MSVRPPAFRGMMLAKKGETWDVPADVDDSLAAAFPAIDRQVEYAKAADWLRASAANRKTAKGMHRFLRNWFETAQNRARAAPAQRARDTRCAFHLNWNNNRRKPPGGWYVDCPSCKEARAAMGDRQGDAATARDLVAETEARLARQRDVKPASPDELAEMRRLRGATEARPPSPPAAGSGTSAARPGGSSVQGPVPGQSSPGLSQTQSG